MGPNTKSKPEVYKDSKSGLSMDPMANRIQGLMFVHVCKEQISFRVTRSFHTEKRVTCKKSAFVIVLHSFFLTIKH